MSSGPATWAREILHAQVELGGERQDPLGVLEHDRPGRRERDMPGPAIEEADVEVLLELLDLERHGRLRHEQCLCGLGEGLVLCNRVKNLKASIGHEFA